MFSRYAGLIMTAGLFVLSGCGSRDAAVVTEVAKAKPGANGGIAFPIPETKGYAEVVVERSKPGQPVVVAVYFLNESATAAASVAPTSVSSKLVLPTADEPKTVSLSAKEKTGSKKSVGTRFATEPGAYDFDELSGELLVTIDGKELTVPFAMR